MKTQKGAPARTSTPPDKAVEDGRHSFKQSIKTVKLVKSLVTVFFLPLVKKKLI
ncbi:hypothetical protein FC13_GL001965 [Lacticaseibacillus casei DSM 20011 = JCM 1134 = ATCC 393]|nr:hypothetical protein FC13_GL001965 [Lacticaseibacillus casei DSM 20011 = JCM 1134 = ATCC 393]